MGEGWGGASRGAGSGGDAKPFSAQHQPANRRGPDTPEAVLRRELKRARTEQLEDHLFHLARNAERQETQVTAAVRLHAIYDGPPIARTISANADVSDLTDEEIRERIAARLADARTAPQGIAGKEAGD